MPCLVGCLALAFPRMALFLVLLVILGFGPSFYLRGYMPSPRPNPTLPPSVLLHGGIFTLWMLAIVAQTQLISARKHAVHMKLGMATVLLAILMIPIMYLAGVWQVQRANQPPQTASSSVQRAWATLANSDGSGP